MPRQMSSMGAAVLALISMVIISARIADAGENTSERSLVLGGGGPIGEAWESGVIAGLAQKGFDLSRSRRIIGTSAGAIVGARLASGMTPDELAEAALTHFEGPPPPTRSGLPAPDLSFLVGKLEELNAAKLTEQEAGVEIGHWAMRVHPIATEAEFVASYWRRFPGKQWPSPHYECVSIDADDGSLTVWNQSSQVPLALAVASSCALPGLFQPVTIDGHRYMDGGARSATNADLARGCKTAIVMAPTSGINHPLGKLSVFRLEHEVLILRDSGCEVAVIVPDPASVAAFARSGTQDERNAAALEAGREQGRHWDGLPSR